MERFFGDELFGGFEVVGWQGLEPWTNALKGHCSTN
jgi:hypothetical protein